MEKWIPVKVDVETVDRKGRNITLKSVPAERNRRRNITRVDIDEVIKRVRAVERRQKTIRSVA